MKKVIPNSLPTPKGHYSPAIVHNGTVYVSGILPVNQKGEAQLVEIEEQVQLCFNQIEIILKEAGSDLSHILKVNIFICDIDLWARVNVVYSKILGAHKPARIVVPTPNLHHGVAIEVDCIAAVKQV